LWDHLSTAFTVESRCEAVLVANLLSNARQIAVTKQGLPDSYSRKDLCIGPSTRDRGLSYFASEEAHLEGISGQLKAGSSAKQTSFARRKREFGLLQTA
jgi:hypothetical protein